MKKLLSVLLIIMLACAAAQAETLVVWFSCTGHTEALADTAAQALNADAWQIVPEEPYTDADLNYSDDSCRANREQDDDSCRPAYTGEADLSGYDTVLLAYPIWWGKEPRIIDTWVENTDLAGKRVAAVCTSGSSGIETSYSNLQAMAPEAQWLGAKRFTADTSAEEFTKWSASIGLE